MRARRKKLTRADFSEYRGYFYRLRLEPVPVKNMRCRVYEPDGTFICLTAVDDAEQVIDEDIGRRAAKAVA